MTNDQILRVKSPDPQTPEMRMQTEIELLKDKLYNVTRERDAAIACIEEIKLPYGCGAEQAIKWFEDDMYLAIQP